MGKQSLVILIIALFTSLCSSARAEDKEIIVRSSNDLWQLSTMFPEKILVGDPFVISVNAKSTYYINDDCPALVNLILDMPQHGHGSDYKAYWERRTSCEWVLKDIVPTMKGKWRLRLVLKWKNTESVSDFEFNAE